MIRSFQITVKGKVQNVGFRYYTKRTAGKMALRGFVKNRPDGSVYIEAEGEEEIISHFISWCHQGPEWARVDEVVSQEQPLQGYKDFVIR